MNDKDYPSGFFISKKPLALLFILWTLVVSLGYIYQQIIINYQIICETDSPFKFICQLF
jgi:hypothetical protein